MRFDHVGVLVEDLEQAKAFVRDVLGLGEPTREVEVADQGLAAAFFALGAGELEVFTLAQGRAPEGPATIDHVAVRVSDLDAERERLSSHGVRFTNVWQSEHIEQPVELRGKRHLWTDPATSAGYRIQLIEDPS